MNINQVKRYTLWCAHPTEWTGEREAFSSNERGAVIARAYQHEEEQCIVRVHDSVTGKDIEL